MIFLLIYILYNFVLANFCNVYPLEVKLFLRLTQIQKFPSSPYINFFQSRYFFFKKKKQVSNALWILEILSKKILRINQ